MSLNYRPVHWTRDKVIYDMIMTGGVVVYIAAFVGASKALWGGEHAMSDEVLVLRALGSCAFILLTAILCIGPLARLNPALLPLLRNRRHLGVLTFLVALAHALLALGYYHGFGVLDPLTSLLATSTGARTLGATPFQVFGVPALVVLFVMAATSHDFWLSVLSPTAWKRLHMLVYVAYVLIIAHVAFGALQSGRGPLMAAVVTTTAAVVAGLHLAAGARQRAGDRRAPEGSSDDAWLDAGLASAIPPGRARVVRNAAGERIAVFRHEGGVSAVTNVCAHQGGPLGEGRVVDGCVTCPWHGWQYRPADGCAPAPFTEKIATYRVRVHEGRVKVDPRALAPGTFSEPAGAGESAGGESVSGNPAGERIERGGGIVTLRRFVPAALAVLMLAGVMLARSQPDPGTGVWEDGTARAFTGTLVLDPYPMLLADDRGDGVPGAMLVVELGKHGAQRRVGALGGQRVELSGFLLRRDGRSMVELEPGDEAVRPLGEAGAGASRAVSVERLGRVTLRGEIVDSKCFLGAMKPGDGKTHKQCAMLCILGGIPPALVTRDEQGRATFYVLVAPDGGEMPEEIRPLIADPVEVTGELEIVGGAGEGGAGGIRLLRVASRDVRPR